MVKYFITYGDEKFKEAREKIISDAKKTNEFDFTIAYTNNELSNDLRHSSIISVPRGGGLWSWKPDVIWQTMRRTNDGDIIVYCDSGCTLYETKDWGWFWKRLKTNEIIAQCIPMRTDKWTRIEIFEAFPTITCKWDKCYQYEATSIVLKVSPFTRMFIEEWRDIMLYKPELVMDVTADERVSQHNTFIENRHDQSIYSALIYKYLSSLEYCHKIHTCWDRIEDCSFPRVQAIRATRLRHGEVETKRMKAKAIIKRMIKQYVYIPFYYNPLQLYYSRRGK